MGISCPGRSGVDAARLGPKVVERQCWQAFRRYRFPTFRSPRTQGVGTVKGRAVARRPVPSAPLRECLDLRAGIPRQSWRDLWQIPGEHWKACRFSKLRKLEAIRSGNWPALIKADCYRLRGEWQSSRLTRTAEVGP